MYKRQAYLNFVGDEFKDRHAGDRLENVSVLMAENNELELESGRYDAVFLSLTFHDFYLDSSDGWPRIDIDKLLAELHSGLRAGGTVTIIDHYADAGSSTDTAESLHRIDPALVDEVVAESEFILEASSDLLAHPEDDHTLRVFDPSLRGDTDRFILRLRKPE